MNFVFALVLSYFYLNLLGKTDCLKERIISVKTKNCSCGEEKSVRGRVIGGIDAQENEFPWQVAMFYKEKYQCGAALISDRYILTAAHCFKMAVTAEKVLTLNQENITFLLGTNDLSVNQSSYPSIIRRPIKSVIHDYYNPHTYFCDIAVSKLDTPITEYAFNIFPICLPPSQRDFVGTKATISGWGSTGGETKVPEIVLKKTTVKVLPQETCEEKLDGTPFNNSVMMCAASDGHDACQGDSGGPLTSKLMKHKYFQIGLVSFGIGCGDKDYPGIYTRINKFSNWILFHTSDGLYCNK